MGPANEAGDGQAAHAAQAGDAMAQGATRWAAFDARAAVQTPADVRSQTSKFGRMEIADID